MLVKNTARGWRIFANKMLKYLADGQGQTVEAEVEINGELDHVQLTSLQYGMLEFDRIEVLYRKVIPQKRLVVRVNSTEDGYRVLHYFKIIAHTRDEFELVVYFKDQKIVDESQKEESANESGGGLAESEEGQSVHFGRIFLGRIFPLLCIGMCEDNRSIAPYSRFVTLEEAQVARGRLQELFDYEVVPPEPKSAVDIMEYYVLDRLRRMFEDMSGTARAILQPADKKELQAQLQEILLAQMPDMNLLTRMLWTISLWSMMRSKDLLKREDSKWSLDMETIHCSRLDAIAYGEGLLQLIENACIHSDMRRAYLSIRIHHTDVTGLGASELSHTSRVRLALQRRLRSLADDVAPAVKGTRAPAYRLNAKVKYCFEFQVINGSDVISDLPPERQTEVADGITGKYLFRLGLLSEQKRLAEKWGDNLLPRVFQDKLLPEKLERDPMYLVQHYGLRIFERTVRLNDGYFYVSSPGPRTRKGQFLERYQSFNGDEPEAVFPLVSLEPYTTYFIFLPVFPHWHTGDRADEPASSRPQDLFDWDGLRGDYRQLILRFFPPAGAENGETRFFREKQWLQGPEVRETAEFAVQPVHPEEKIGAVQRIYRSIEQCLKDEDGKTVCLLDLMRIQHYGQVELLAKALFLLISKGRLTKGEGQKLPHLFALLLPAKEHTWEFIRIFSIFCQKLDDKELRAQIALCVYPEGQKEHTPEVAFLLAGGSLSSVHITARIFAYYNTGSTIEAVPQLRYLTRGGDREAMALPQFPFDLFLTARTEFDTRQGETSWFLRNMDRFLKNDLWQRPLGCRIHGIKVRMKSNILLTDFYEAELLFHNIGIIYRFAYLVARDILRQMEGAHSWGKLVLVGYENYSTVLVNQVVDLLRKAEKGLDVQYLIHSGLPGSGQTLHLSPELQSMEQTKRAKYFQDAVYTAVIPMGSTLSTVYRIQSEVEALAGKQEDLFPLEHYVLIVVGCQPKEGTIPLSDQYWRQRLAVSQEPGIVELEPLRKDYPPTRVRFFLQPSTHWSQRHETDRTDPLEEKVLVYVDQTSTIPREIFVGAQSRFSGMIELIGGKQDRQENDRRAELLKSCIHYGHMAASNNHFQFYFDIDQYYAKAVESSLSKPWNKSIPRWLRSLRHTVDPNAYNIIVSPLHQEDSPFAKAVADQVFEHSLRFLHIDFSDTFREDIRAKFSYVAEEYAQIKRFDATKTVNVYFVNTAITSGFTIQRARNLLMMLMEESGMAYDRGNVFKGCFVIINRSGFDTLNSYIANPKEQFHAYVHLAVPSLNLRKDRCPTCELTEQYRRIERRCSSDQLRREFLRLAKKHEKRNVADFIRWQKDTVMAGSGYNSWLRQWLDSYVGRGRTVGVFEMDQAELKRLKNLRCLLDWGLKRFLKERGLSTPPAPERQEEYLEVLGSFSLRDLRRLVEEDREGALKSLGKDGDKYCLTDEYWQHVMLDYVCGQKNYMRLMSIHTVFLETEDLVKEMEGAGLEERGRLAGKKLLEIISDNLPENGPEDLKVEWLISYLKVISRPHLAQYHHIRQGSLTILLQLVDAALRENLDGVDPKIADLSAYLREERKISPLMQYQLLKTILKRLAGLQSTYFLNERRQKQLLQMIGRFRRRYFERLPDGKSTKEQRRAMESQPFPPAKDIRITMVKLVKWASSCGDDENGCYLIEEEFGKEGDCDDRDGMGTGAI